MKITDKRNQTNTFRSLVPGTFFMWNYSRKDVYLKVVPIQVGIMTVQAINLSTGNPAYPDPDTLVEVPDVEVILR